MDGGKPKIISSALLAGTLAGIISAIPYLSGLNCCCFWFILGGFWAAYLVWHPQKSANMGTMVGTAFLSGIVAATVYSVLSTILFSMSSEMTIAQMQQAISTSGQEIPPEFMEAVEELIRSPVVAFLVIFAFSILVFPIGSVLGGLLGGLILRNKSPQDTQVH